jgi:hypothetical protein
MRRRGDEPTGWMEAMRNSVPKLSARDAVARSYPSWDHGMADRMIAWLDHCGYAIVEKDHGHSDATAHGKTARQQERTH